MKINIMAGRHQSIHNDDPIEKHKFCMNNSVQWYKYKKQLTSSDQSFSTQTKDNKLPTSFLPYMLPLYTRLSDEALLQRCVAGLTQTKMNHLMQPYGKDNPKKFWHCCSPTCSEIGYLVLECGLPRTSTGAFKTEH